MSKPNFDRQRVEALARIHAERIKAAAAKKLADEKAAKEAVQAQNEVSDAKTD